MSEDRRVALIRDAFDAFMARDVAGVAAFLRPDVDCRVLPPLMNSGSWRGYEGFAEMTASWEEAFGEITYEILGTELADERTAVVEVRQEATGAGSGVPVALDVYFLIEFEGEQAARFEIHATRESALAAV